MTLGSFASGRKTKLQGARTRSFTTSAPGHANPSAIHGGYRNHGSMTKQMKELDSNSKNPSSSNLPASNSPHGPKGSNDFGSKGDNSNGSGSKNSDSNGSNGSTHPDPSSNNHNGSLPPCSLFPPGFGPYKCQFISTGQIVFGRASNWTQDAGPRSFCAGPSFTATTSGSQASIQFNGELVFVFGHLHAGNTTPPEATYTIDANTSYETSVKLPLLISPMDAPYETFFQSPPLLPGNHSLDINVTSIISPMNYTMTGIVSCSKNSGSGALQNSTETSQSFRESHPKLEAGAIAAIVIACISFIAFLALGCFLFIRRQRRMRSARTADSPIHRWLERHCTRSDLFTSSTSIMRNTPSDHSAVQVIPFDQSTILEKSEGSYASTAAAMSPRSPSPRPVPGSTSSRQPGRKLQRYPSTWTLPSFHFSDRNLDHEDVPPLPPLPVKPHPS
ncbi:hypothetical protein BDY19DRAFT_769334 [Irpex rosettiformis]|uniref:Uncharacterized protein n=1 Tax=Irpex rosettiformis TaxID=378272 RepID=A0ACB8U809_9APHY|nr:hypothetical protein BDY19DRAFT_769334 [Irpex rosettiformis]